jgi:hypothetical protein
MNVSASLMDCPGIEIVLQEQHPTAQGLELVKRVRDAREPQQNATEVAR